MSFFSSVKTVSLGLAVLACLLVAPVRAGITLDWVTVGDPGNTADTAPTGYGAVATSFQIMKYEYTNQQYTEFLNSVDVGGGNLHSVYNASMSSDPLGGISFTSGTAAGSKYAIKTNMGDKPVNYVSWFDAARVSNWLMNGATSSSSTEMGAYTLVNGQISGTAPALNPGASISIPSEDQWYKAAYYKGGGRNAGYWDYATQSDTAPTTVTAGSTGVGSAGGTGNFANYNLVASWNSQTGNVTTVGTNGGAIAYGAFDMSGNVYEWNDLTGTAGSSRGVRGGVWASNAFAMSSSSRGSLDPSFEGNYFGFRLANPSSSSVPEIDPDGWRAVLGLIVAGLGIVERRRYDC